MKVRTLLVMLSNLVLIILILFLVILLMVMATSIL